MKKKEVTWTSNKEDDEDIFVSLIMGLIIFVIIKGIMSLLKNKRIEFVGAVAHQFSDEIPYSIILDLDELDMKHFFSSNKDLLEEKKNSGWPLMYSSVEELEEMLQENDSRYYVLYSSYGMTGWVLAERVEIINLYSKFCH